MVFVKSDMPSNRLTLKSHLILYYTFIIPFNGKRKMVNCTNLQRSIPEKQIFFPRI